MQTMGVTGKIYNLKHTAGQQQGKGRVTLRVSVRKEFVSDQDKQANKTNVFLPMIAYGPTAEFINQYFKDGDTICIKDMEYQTYRTQNAPNEYDDAHIFKVNKVGFVPGANDNGQGGGQRNQNQNQNQNQGGSYNGGGNQGGYGGGAPQGGGYNQNQNQGGGYGGGQPAGAPAGGGYQPSDDLPF